jgi:hypothetical protein
MGASPGPPNLGGPLFKYPTTRSTVFQGNQDVAHGRAGSRMSRHHLWRPLLLNNPNGVNLDELIDFLITRKQFLRPEQLQRLQIAFPAPNDPTPPPVTRFGSEFDLLEEIQTQINAVQILRDRVIQDGELAEGVSVRDAKEALSAATSLITTLNKVYQEIVNANRLRQVELATVEVIKEFPEVHAHFFPLLKPRLESLE